LFEDPAMRTTNRLKGRIATASVADDMLDVD
jgi:hypothetical protein